MRTETNDVRPYPSMFQFGYAAPSLNRLLSPEPPLFTDEGLCRLRDVVLASLALIALSPLMAVIAVLIAIDSAGPVFFVQRRGGRFGTSFGCIKFRTMRVMEDGATVRQATRGDRRVTRVGRILRRFSLDELPQLINVLKGEMSLVGPRPHALAHDVAFSRQAPDYMKRYAVLPGITGLAQVSGARGECNSAEIVRERVAYDLAYVENKSFWVDLKILVLTPFILFGSKMAY